MRILIALLAASLLALVASADRRVAAQAVPAVHDWPAYGGGPAAIRYSPLAQITRANVKSLRVAWTYDSGEEGGLQTNPIVVGRTLYTTTPLNKTVALDAATGAVRWTFDAGFKSRGPNRGVTYWTDGRSARIFAAAGHYLYALDAETGKPIETFGRAGRIDLHEGLGRPPELQSVQMTTPGVIYRDLLIVGGRVNEGLPASPGDIRAIDVRTGATRWTFRTIPAAGEPGAETWPAGARDAGGGANNWAGMAVDTARGIVFVPTGSAAADFYGADRLGDNLYANTLLALDAATGRRLWHFQTVHHDIWDRDLPAPPALVTVTHDGRRVDAVAQTSKQGIVWLFERATGTPLFPIEERPYPASAVAGERASRTQPQPVKPAPFARQRLTEDMLTRRTPAAHAAVLEAFRRFRSDGQFVPLDVGIETVVFPGFDGGGG
ncbi:MAG: PQQ-binding-like beta-propeller repeat protein, partial [Vicinamibacteria bacterium]